MPPKSTRSRTIAHDPDLNYQIGEHVWCLWDKRYYKAKILDLKLKIDNEQYYFIHYWKFPKSWDMTVAESRILPMTTKNNKLVQVKNREVSRDFKKQKQEKQIKEEEEKKRKKLQRIKEVLLMRLEGKTLTEQEPFLRLHNVQIHPGHKKFRTIGDAFFPMSMESTNSEHSISALATLSPSLSSSQLKHYEKREQENNTDPDKEQDHIKISLEQKEEVAINVLGELYKKQHGSNSRKIDKEDDRGTNAKASSSSSKRKYDQKGETAGGNDTVWKIKINKKPKKNKTREIDNCFDKDGVVIDDSLDCDINDISKLKDSNTHGSKNACSIDKQTAEKLNDSRKSVKLMKGQLVTDSVNELIGDREWVSNSNVEQELRLNDQYDLIHSTNSSNGDKLGCELYNTLTVSDTTDSLITEVDRPETYLDSERHLSDEVDNFDKDIASQQKEQDFTNLKDDLDNLGEIGSSNHEFEINELEEQLNLNDQHSCININDFSDTNKSSIETLNTSYALDINPLKNTKTTLTIVESRSETSLDVVLDALDEIRPFSKNLKASKSEEPLLMDGFSNDKDACGVDNLCVETLNTSYTLDNDAIKTTNTFLTTVESNTNLDAGKDALDVEIERFNKDLETSKPEESLHVDEGFLNLKVSLDVDNSSLKVINNANELDSNNLFKVSTNILQTTEKLRSKSNLDFEQDSLDEIGQFNKEFETSKLDEPLRLDEGFLNSKDFLDVDKSSIDVIKTLYELDSNVLRTSNTVLTVGPRSGTSLDVQDALHAEIESFNKEFETFKAEEQLTLDECQCSFVNSMDSSVTDQSSCRVHRIFRKQQHNQLDTTNLILTTMTQSQTDLDDEGNLLDVDQIGLYEEVTLTTSDQEELSRVDNQHDSINLKDALVVNNSCCEVLCSPNMKDNIPSQTTNLYATSAVSHLEKHFNSDRYTLDIENGHFNEIVTTSKVEEHKSLNNQQNVNLMDFSTSDPCCFVKQIITSYCNKRPCRISSVAIVNPMSDSKKNFVDTRNTLNGEQPSISIKLEPSMDSEDRIIENIPDCQVSGTSILKKNSLCTNINIFFSPTHQSNFEHHLDRNEKSILNEDTRQNSNVSVKLEQLAEVQTLSVPKENQHQRLHDLTLNDNYPRNKSKSSGIASSLASQTIVNTHNWEYNGFKDLSTDADNLNVKKSSASTNINLMKTKKDKKKIKDHKRSGDDLYAKKAKVISSSKNKKDKEKNKIKINDRKAETNKEGYHVTKKKVCPSTLTNEFVNKKNTRDHESEVTKEDEIRKVTVHKKHQKRKLNIKYLEKDGTVVGDFRLDSSRISSSSVSTTETVNERKIKDLIDINIDGRHIKKSRESSLTAINKLKKRKNGEHQEDDRAMKSKKNSLTPKLDKKKTTGHGDITEVDDLVDSGMKSTKVTSSSKNKTKYHKRSNDQDKKDKEHKMLKKIRSKDVVDIFLNKAVGDFQLYRSSNDNSNLNKTNSGIDDSLKSKIVNNSKRNDDKSVTNDDGHIENSKMHKKHKKNKDHIYLKKDHIDIRDYQLFAKSSHENWSCGSASSSPSIPQSNHQMESEDDNNRPTTDDDDQCIENRKVSKKKLKPKNDGQTTDDEDQYVQNRKVSKKILKLNDVDRSVYELFGFEKSYSRAAKVKANKAILQMSKPPVGKDKKNDGGKRSKNGKKDDDDPSHCKPTKLSDYNLVVPPYVQRILVEDKHLIEDDRFIAILPAKLSVHSILKDYSSKFEVDAEILDIMLDAFDHSLKSWLLHPLEKPKYDEMIMKFPDKPMYTIYGLAHLLRFIIKLPKLFDILSSVKNEFVPNALHFVNGLFVYLVDENFQISIQDYDCVLPDYYRMAYFA